MSLSAHIKKHIDDVRASYWFIPTVLVLAAIVLAIGSLLVDGHPTLSKLRPDWIIDLVSAEGARAVVSVIAQSMIGVAGVLFSITMLAVSFASGQFGPRLIGNFMRDRGNQWTLGILISTFAFALLVLHAIVNPYDEVAAFVPHLSILLTMVLAFISVFAMIYHVHHVPETISVSNIIAGLGQRFRDDIQALIGTTASTSGRPSGASVDVFLRSSGYIYTIAQSKLSKIAEDQDWSIEILEPAGEFMHPRRAALRVWGPSMLDEDMVARLRGAVALGRVKTENQNLIFVAEQLVEIVARAMSPGVNDPFTAISCMHWMEAGLAELAGRDDALQVLSAKGVIAEPISFGFLLEHSLGDCRPYVQSDPLTRDAMLKVLHRLADLASTAHRGAIATLIDQVRSKHMPRLI